MPGSARSRLRDWLTAQRNVVVFAAILVAVPVTGAYVETVGGGEGSVLLLLTLAVVVPQAYLEHWPAYDATWKAVAWVVVACAVATVEFAVLFVVGTELLALAPLHASAGAFLVTTLGTLVVLSRRRRHRDEQG